MTAYKPSRRSTCGRSDVPVLRQPNHVTEQSCELLGRHAGAPGFTTGTWDETVEHG